MCFKYLYCSNFSRFSFLFTGRNPIKENSHVSNPELVRAEINAQAPGIATTSILFFIACLTISNPGSEIAGVPASETRAMFSPI